MAAERPGFARLAWLSAAAVAGGFVLLLQACFGTREGPPVPPALQRLSSAATLAPFFARLAALGGTVDRPPVRILQIGDSHTANDSLSGRMREQFQERFGAAGRGWLPAGVPFRYYRPHLVSVSESGWQHIRPNDHSGVALGLDASAAENEPHDAVMTMASTEPGGFDRFAVEYVAQPNGSAFTVTVDGGAAVRVATALVASEIKEFELALDRPAHQVELRAEGRPPVVLLGWTIERQRTTGVIYENHGTIGATVGLVERMTPQAVAFELQKRAPALLIVAFGTNEGFDDDLDLGRYPGRFESNIEALRRAAGGVPVLVLGPPDGNRGARGCPRTPCGADDACAWAAPAKLGEVRELERRIAAQRGWAYWDWFGAMGGTCSIDRMSSASPPLAMPDHVHLSAAGYRSIADLLFGDLMRAYEEWKAQPRTS